MKKNPTVKPTIESDNSKEDPLVPNLPEIVPCVLGPETSYDSFKAHYEAVFDQVQKMDHLLMGRVTYSGTVGPLKFSMHSLKQSEDRTLSLFSPDPNSSEFDAKLADYELYRVAMSLTSVNGTNLPITTVSRGGDKDSWLDSAKSVLDMLSEYDSFLISFLSNSYNDILRAKHLAFMEMMPNP